MRWTPWIALPLLLCSCNRSSHRDQPAQEPAYTINLDFERDAVGKVPADFATALTGGGGSVTWEVREDRTSPRGSKVLAQTSPDKTNLRFPLCLYQKLSARDVSVAVAFKAVSGEVDQAAGIVVRYQDENNYYVVRANALEDNVRLYKVEKGQRKQFAGKDVKVSGNAWHVLDISVEGFHFVVGMDGQRLFDATDDTFNSAGKVGLWTKADSVTQFDDFRALSKDAR